MTPTPQLSISTRIHISKPVNDVFEAIADPKHMTQYFISESSGRMEADKTLKWKFAEMDLVFPVKVNQVRPASLISFTWQDFEGKDLSVEISLQAVEPSRTLIIITEGEKENNEAGIKWLKENTEGWANFLACLKAYVEYGINLRKGAFSAAQMPEEARNNAG